MAIEDIPLWPLRPNWREPITERLEWLTAVLTSRSGAEQTFGLRTSPRRFMEFTFSGSDRARTLFATGNLGIGRDPWYLPLWHDQMEVTSPSIRGTNTLYVDTTNREIQVGSRVRTFNARSDDVSPTDNPIYEVAAIGSGFVTLTTNLVSSLPAGALAFPAVKARLVDTVSLSRITSRVGESRVQFEVLEPNDFIGEIASITEYEGIQVLTVAPNYGLDLTAEFERMFDRVDNRTGIPEQFHTSPVGFMVRSHNWTALGRAQYVALKSQFYRMAGRNNPVWLPTFERDLTILDPVGEGDNFIRIDLAGFSQYFNNTPTEGADRIEIALKDGTRLRRRIMSTSSYNSQSSLVVLDSGLPAFEAYDVMRTSFLTLSRLNTDTIEFEHLTDVDRITRAAATFRTRPNTRTANDYEVVYDQDVVMNDLPCGVAAVATHWKLVRLGTAGSSTSGTYMVISSVEMAAVPGGPNLCTGGSYASDDAWVVGQPLSNLFDGDDATYGTCYNYEVNPGRYNLAPSFVYIFPTPVSISEVRLRANSANPDCMPRGFVLLYSTDEGATWNPTEPVGPLDAWAADEQRSFAITPFVPKTRSTARLWRISGWVPSGSHYIREFRFRAAPGGPTLCVGGVGNTVAAGITNLRPQYAFDESDGTYWFIASGDLEWPFISYFFPTAPDPAYFNMKIWIGNTPSAFNIEWSGDGVTWNLDKAFAGLVSGSEWAIP